MLHPSPATPPQHPPSTPDDPSRVRKTWPLGSRELTPATARSLVPCTLGDSPVPAPPSHRTSHAPARVEGLSTTTGQPAQAHARVGEGAGGGGSHVLVSCCWEGARRRLGEILVRLQPTSPQSIGPGHPNPRSTTDAKTQCQGHVWAEGLGMLVRCL